VQLESALVPDYPQGKGKGLLDESFQKAVNEKWHCSVDVDAALEFHEWKDFFDKLNGANKN
jgi:hypothetical protein